MERCWTGAGVWTNLWSGGLCGWMQAMVVGVTHRQDVVEMLEKRVKSRFSHRILDVTAPQGVEPLHPGAGGEEGGASAAAPEPDDGMLGVLQVGEVALVA